MSLKTILASLVLVGSSTAAFARPVEHPAPIRATATVSVNVRDHRDIDGRYERERREEARERQERARDEWNRRPVTVTQPVIVEQPVYPAYPVAPQLTQIQGPMMLYSGSQAEVYTQNSNSPIGRLSGFSTLKLDGVGQGSTYIDSITLYYPTTAQVVPVKQWVNAGGCFDLPIANGAAIVQMAISGTSVNGGQFTVDAI